MDCDSVRQQLLAYGGDAADRQSMAAALAHGEQCATCREALSEYDRLQKALCPPELRTAEPSGGWDTFEQKLLRSVKRRPSSWPARGMGFSLAAALVLAAFGWGLYWQGLGEVGSAGSRAPAAAGPGAGSPRLAALGSGEVADRVRAFREVAEVFEHRTSWVLLAERGSDLGLGHDPGERPGELMVMRLLVTQSGKLMSSADLMMLRGGSADVEVPTGTGLTLRYQIASSDRRPQHLQVWVELKASGAGESSNSILATDLAMPTGELASIGQIVTSAGPCDVLVELHPTDLRT